MKRTAKAELRAKSAAELTEMATKLRQELLKSRMAAVSGGKPLGGAYRHARRQIARLETLASEKTRAAGAANSK